MVVLLGKEVFMKLFKRFKIGIFGSAAGSEIEKIKSLAKIIGREIAKRNGILVTGACTGLPYEAALGAHEAGGVVLGFSPAQSLLEHIEKYKFPVEPHILVFTGMGFKARNVICTRSCDAGIFISGRTGTMSEFANLYDEADKRKVLALLAGSGGVIDNYLTPFIAGTEKPSKAKIVIDNDPVALVEAVFKNLSFQVKYKFPA